RVGFPRREVPDAGEHDDHRHDDEAHHRVVEHRERVERLPASLDVLLVLLELSAPFVDRRHQTLSPPLRRHVPRAVGRVRPLRPFVVTYSSTSSDPAASFDHGGDVTPSRTTRY